MFGSATPRWLGSRARDVSASRREADHSTVPPRGVVGLS